MANTPRPNAQVFRQNEVYFGLAAEAVKYDPFDGPGSDGSLSRMRLHGYLQSEAPALDTHLMGYGLSVVTRLNADMEARSLEEKGTMNIRAFTVATLMTFKMVDGVCQNTKTKLPSFEGTLDETVRRGPTELTYDEDTPLIDVYFRGAELRDRLPHVYRPAFILMEKMLGTPADELEADLSKPIGDHDDRDKAVSKLHFIGGAAEVALSIEEAACAAK